MLKEAIEQSRVAAGVPFTLRLKQQETLEAVLGGGDVLSVLPTSYGKTLTYALLPAAWDALSGTDPGNSIVLVISPLIALMEEQLVRMDTLGVPAAYLGSDDSTPELLEKVRAGHFPIVLMSPEAIFTDRWRNILESQTYRSRVKTIAVDECHCAVIWGEEFRKDYGRIGELRSLLKGANVLALTASAPPTMRPQIYEAIAIRTQDLKVIEMSADRHNIYYSAETATNTIEGSLYWLVEELREKKRTCRKFIIYCRSVNDCANVYEFFDEQLEDDAFVGVRSFRNRLFGMFHRPTCHRVKKFIVNHFSKPDSPVRVVICTVAFGMGIDVGDITGVIHWGASRTFEGFYQESGRCGRDTVIVPKAFSIMYFRPINISNRSCDSNMRKYCQNEENLCRRKHILRHFSPNLPPIHTVEMHNCCNVCRGNCSCGDCPLHIPPQLQATDMEIAKCGAPKGLGRDVSPEQREELRAALWEVRARYTSQYSFISASIRTGLDQTKINAIVDGSPHIHSVDDLMTDYLYDGKIASQVMDKIDSIFE